MTEAAAQLAALSDEIQGIAERFAVVSEAALVASLERATEQLVARHADWFNALDDAAAAALRKTMDETIRASADRISEELRNPGLWISPNVLLERTEEHEEFVWDWASVSQNPFVAILDYVSLFPSDRKRVRHTEHDPLPEDDLDHPLNRVWVHLSNGADQLDGVLAEFGLEPAVPDWGGGHYGLQPKTVEELDPSGELERIWDRYVDVYGEFRKLAREAGLGDRAEAERAVDRWRDTAGPS